MKSLITLSLLLVTSQSVSLVVLVLYVRVDTYKSLLPRSSHQLPTKKTASVVFVSRIPISNTQGAIKLFATIFQIDIVKSFLQSIKSLLNLTFSKVVYLFLFTFVFAKGQ